MGVRKPKNYALNLNVYRNTHFIQLNNSKVLFDTLIQPRIKNLVIKPPFIIRYTLYIGSNRECDVANVCSIVDKYFCDALVKAKIIPDDNYKYLKGVSYEFGSVDKDNPRVDAQIEEIEECK